MPTPREDETQEAFIARCIPIVLEDGTATDNEQAVAVCYSMWENRDEQGVEGREMDSKSKAQEHKTLPFFVTKIDGDQGVVEHTVAVMGNVDLGGDRIQPGAFTKTITERAGKIRVLDAHNSTSILNVIGKPLSLWEVSRDELPAKVRTAYPDATGALMARTQFLMDTPEGAGAFSRIRDGAVDEYSIGYDPITAEYSDETVAGEERAVRNLKEIRLWEYSPVPWGMNPATSTVSAKADKQAAIDNLAAFLADATLDQRADLWQAWIERTAKQALEQSNTDTADPSCYVGKDAEPIGGGVGDKGPSGSTSLPLASRDRQWDSQAAVARVRRATDSEEEPSARYKDAFFWYDSSEPDNFTSYKLPFADAVDGTLTAVPRGVFAAAAVVQGSRGGVDLPQGDVAGVRSKIEQYYARMRSEFEDEGIVVPWDKAAEPDTETKIGRAISAANAARIRAAIDGAQEALADLEALLETTMDTEDEPEQDEPLKGAPGPDAQAATGQDEQAGPPDQAPTSEVTVADIDDILSALEQELSEEP